MVYGMLREDPEKSILTVVCHRFSSQILLDSRCEYPFFIRQVAVIGEEQGRAAIDHRCSCRSPSRVVAEADQQFAEVLALQQADKGFRGMVEALDNVLALFELA